MNAEQSNIQGLRQQIEELRSEIHNLKRPEHPEKPKSVFDQSIFHLKEAIATATRVLDQSPIPGNHVNRLSLRLDGLTASLNTSIINYTDGQIDGRTLIQITKQTAEEMKQIEEMLFQY